MWDSRHLGTVIDFGSQMRAMTFEDRLQLCGTTSLGLGGFGKIMSIIWNVKTAMLVTNKLAYKVYIMYIDVSVTISIIIMLVNHRGGTFLHILFFCFHLVNVSFHLLH